MIANKITTASKECLELIAKWEGFKAEPYLCPAKVPTIGFGTTRYPNGVKVSLSDLPVTKEKAMAYLMHDVSVFSKQVDALATDALTQSQFDALVSFAYNLGVSNLRNSTLLKIVNQNTTSPRIAFEFKKWVYAAGKRLQGLISRRNEEAELYFKDMARNN